MAQLSFLKAWMANPQKVGAILPSSPELARTLARIARQHSKDGKCCVEIGAGTGAITHYLAKEFDKVIIFEANTMLCHLLKKQFPAAKVISGNLEDNLDLFMELAIDNCVVSSLPFKSLPPTSKHKCISIFSDFVHMPQNQTILQYSYGVTPPFTKGHSSYWKKLGFVWKNVPPATVWRLTTKS